MYLQLRHNTTEVACTQICPKRCDTEFRQRHAADDTGKRTDQTDRHPADQQRTQLFATREPKRMQECELTSSAQRGQRLTRVNEESARKQSYERKCRQIGSIGTRKTRGFARRLFRSVDTNVAGQHFAQPRAHR